MAPGPTFWRNRLPRIVAACVAFGLVLGGTTGGVAAYYYHHLDHELPRLDTGAAAMVNGVKPPPVIQSKSPDIVQPKKQIHAQNYLVIGSDSRAGVTDAGKIAGQRSDTTMIVHLNPGLSKATIVNIPRDSWIQIPDCKDSKGVDHPAHMGMFNSAFSEALPDGSPARSGAGATCMIATVQKLTGIEIKHFVQIDLAGFQKVVDALHGVTICSPMALVHPEDDKHLVLKKGDNHLDGTQAIEYVRLRHIGTGSDLERIQREQRFLGAVLRQARNGSVLTNPAELNSFLSSALQSMLVDGGTDLSDLQTLFNAMRGLDPKHVTFYTPKIANAAYDPANPANPRGSRVLLDYKVDRVLYNQIIDDSKIVPVAATKTVKVAPAAITVAVTNGSTIANLGTKVRGALSSAGFQPGPVSHVPQKATTTLVRYTAAEASDALTVAAALPDAKLILDTALKGPVSVIVGSAYTRVLPVKVGQPLPAWDTLPSAPKTKTVSGGISASDTTCTLTH